MGEILRSRIPRQLWRAGAAFAVVMGVTIGAYYMLGSPRVRLYFLDLVPPLVGFLVVGRRNVTVQAHLQIRFARTSGCDGVDTIFPNDR